MSLDDFINNDKPREEMHEWAGDVLDSNDIKKVMIQIDTDPPTVEPLPTMTQVEIPAIGKPLKIEESKFVNQVIHGDCIKVMDSLPSNYVDLIVTDPPYLINYKTNHRQDKTHDFCTPIEGDTDKGLISEYIKQCYRIMKKDTAMYMFCSADKVDFFKQELERWFKIKNMIIWVKNNWTAGDLEASFGRQYEIIFLVNKGRKKINGKRITDVWNFDRISGKTQVHQNQKPVDLFMQCIEKHSNEGDLVFDGFGGSGTTAVACLKTNRKYLLIEKEETYINIIQERIMKGE